MPRVASAENASSVRPLVKRIHAAGRRKREKESGRASLTCNGIRYDPPTIVFPRRRKTRIRTPNTDAVDRDSGRASSRLIERSIEERDSVIRYYCYTRDNETKEDLFVNDTQGGVNDGTARRRRLIKGARTLTSEEKRTRTDASDFRLFRRIFLASTHTTVIYDRDKVAYRSRVNCRCPRRATGSTGLANE